MIREITPSDMHEFERVGAHTHVKGLGLDEKGHALFKADGLVGNTKAREALGFVVRLVKKGKFAGRGVLLAGPPGTGKTAFALALARELGKDTPFVAMSGSEIYSAEKKKSEILTENMRKAIGVRIHDIRKIYEGEVKKIDFEMVRNPYNPYQQIPKSARVTIATKKEEKTFEVGRGIALSLLSNEVSEGDVIMIDAESGRVTKVGRSESAKGQHDIEAEMQFVPVPDGPVFKEKEFVYTVRLHDLDVINARRSGFSLFSLFGGGEREIDEDIRRAVNERVRELVESGQAELIPGVLFIDECHLLDIEAFSFLARAMESEMSPIIILATNRGIAKIRGTDQSSPHGIPLDLHDRMLIINTEKYSRDELKEILKLRFEAEKVKYEEDALEYLADIAEKTSLRHAAQLIGPANENAEINGRESVTVEDIKRVDALFADVKRSTEFVSRYEKEFLNI